MNSLDISPINHLACIPQVSLPIRSQPEHLSQAGITSRLLNQSSTWTKLQESNMPLPPIPQRASLKRFLINCFFQATKIMHSNPCLKNIYSLIWKVASYVEEPHTSKALPCSKHTGLLSALTGLQILWAKPGKQLTFPEILLHLQLLHWKIQVLSSQDALDLISFCSQPPSIHISFYSHVRHF